MSASLEICFIEKSGRASPYEGIKSVGGRNPDGTQWRLSEIAAINGIKSGKWRLHVVQGGRQLRVVVGRTVWGYEYLKTEADDDAPNVLLSLAAHRDASESA